MGIIVGYSTMNCIKKTVERAITWCYYGIIVFVCMWAAIYLVRIFFADQFVIPTNSMLPTLIPGDRVIVNKTIMGARLYTNFHFNRDGQTLESVRLRGLRPLNVNDVAVFNFPVLNDTISFKINYVFCKRIVGLPGDTVSIVGGYYRNNNHPVDLGIPAEQAKVAALPENVNDMQGYWCAPWGSGWNIKDYGPLYVPRKGDIAKVDSVFVKHYGRILRFETGKEVKWDAEQRCAIADGNPIDMHVFSHNYYFMAGDNAIDSNDSRYWGLVPEEHIVGVVDFISYSKDKRSGKYNFNRSFKDV